MRSAKILAIVAIVLVMLVVAGQADGPADEIRLVVQGNGMGTNHGVNAGTIQAYKEGILRATNVITPGPWMQHAARLLVENPGLDVGVQLVLTSEWASYRWRPLTCSRSLVDSNGNFFPMVTPTRGFPAGSTLVEANPRIDEVERELRAQIEMAKRTVPQVSYLGTHMGFAGPFPEVQTLVRKLAKEYGLMIPRSELKIQQLPKPYLTTDSVEVRSQKLVAALERLGPGTWFLVDHVAIDSPEMRAIGHFGYENVAADRTAVLAAWTSPRVMKVVARRGIKLIGYRDLLRESAR
jgi:chitin disaccharide deacetylase